MTLQRGIVIGGGAFAGLALALALLLAGAATRRGLRP